MGLERCGIFEDFVEYQEVWLFHASVGLAEEISCFLPHLRNQCLRRSDEFRFLAVSCGHETARNRNSSERRRHWFRRCGRKQEISSAKPTEAWKSQTSWYSTKSSKMPQRSRPISQPRT